MKLGKSKTAWEGKRGGENCRDAFQARKGRREEEVGERKIASGLNNAPRERGAEGFPQCLVEQGERKREASPLATTTE